jgi:hypothetical protein
MRALFLLLLLMLPARAGEHLRFLLPVGPGGRPSTAHAYVFNSRRETIRLVDQGGVSHQAHLNLGAAALSARASAGVNGGPFDSHGTPLGLFIADGKAVGIASGSGPLGGGGVLWEEAGKIGISPSEGFDFEGTHASQLLQAGPFLIANGAAKEGLQASTFHRRTVVLTDGADLWAIAYVPGATLEGLARALAKPGAFPAFRPKTVLNLDGGSSSGLWLRRENGQQFYLREISKIRNCLVIVPKIQG